MSEGEYPKWITRKEDGLKVQVRSEAEEALWVNAPAPPAPVKAAAPTADPHPFGASPMVDSPSAKPAKPAKKGKGAIDA